MKMSDIFDIPIFLKDKNGHYYKLKFYGYALDGFSDFPIQAIIEKGNRITKEELRKMN